MGLPTRMALARENAEREHTLYRLFDESGRLLYVGISSMPGNRFAQHRREKGWWARVAHKECVTFPNRSEAEDAEHQAIVSERPIHNVQWNRRGRV